VDKNRVHGTAVGVCLIYPDCCFTDRTSEFDLVRDFVQLLLYIRQYLKAEGAHAMSLHQNSELVKAHNTTTGHSTVAVCQYFVQANGRGPLTLRPVACSSRMFLFKSVFDGVELLKTRKQTRQTSLDRGSIGLGLFPGIFSTLVTQRWRAPLQGDERLSSGRLCSSTYIY